MRKAYTETVAILGPRGYLVDDERVDMPAAMPRYDDESPSGFSIFRMLVDGEDFSDLDMSRSYFSRSELASCSFANTNLFESNLCWNDFIGTSFAGADLSGADLRASIFDRVDFSSAILAGADLRRSDFTSCIFDGASMKGALLTRKVGSDLPLTDEQRAVIDWQESEGEDPPGG